MKTNWVLTTAVAVSVSATVAAQSAKAMHQLSNGDTMRTTYTGCVESVNHGGAFLLTNVDSRGSKSIHGDKTMKPHEDMMMKHDDIAMTSDAGKTMQREQMPMADEETDAMSSQSFVLAGSTNLSKHIGQRVSVTGSVSDGSMGTMRQDLSTLTIKTLKVVAKSCS